MKKLFPNDMLMLEQLRHNRFPFLPKTRTAAEELLKLLNLQPRKNHRTRLRVGPPAPEVLINYFRR